MIARSRWTGLFYVAPACLLYLPLILLPLLYSTYLSLHHWDGLATEWTWAALENYRQMIGDPVFWRALLHNLILVAASLGLQLPIALGLALLLVRAGRWAGLVRTGLLMPYMLPTVIIALVWQLIIVHTQPLLLGSTTWSLPTVIGIISWRFIGFHMALFLAGLAAIDPHLQEAAELDGAASWDRLRYITLPLLKPVLVVSATLAIIGSMKYFDIIYVLTRGGPAHSTELLATYMYKQAFEARQFGYGSALAVALVITAALAIAAIARASRHWRQT